VWHNCADAFGGSAHELTYVFTSRRFRRRLMLCCFGLRAHAATIAAILLPWKYFLGATQRYGWKAAEGGPDASENHAQASQ
jgi:hypothetical protein